MSEGTTFALNSAFSSKTDGPCNDISIHDLSEVGRQGSNALKNLQEDGIKDTSNLNPRTLSREGKSVMQSTSGAEIW